MYKIGEKLNSSIPATGEAMRSRDSAALAALIAAQSEADCLDINTALCGAGEAELMAELARAVAEKTSCEIMLDSSSPAAIIAALPAAAGTGRRVLVNSVTLTERIDELLPEIIRFHTGVVALPIANKKVPASAAERVENACALYEKLTAAGVKPGDIYIDALVSAVSCDSAAGLAALETVRGLREHLPDAHRVCGLSNASFGLPGRTGVNCAALCALIPAGLDAAIMDVTNERTMSALRAALAFSGEDEFCLDYIDAIRNA